MALLNRIFARRRENYSLPPAITQTSGKRRLWKKIGIGVAVFFVLLILGGFFAAPPIIKSILVNKVSEQLGRQVSVGAIRVNPFLLTVEIDDFLIKEQGSSARFVAFDRLRIDAELESVYRRAPVLREISLTNPYVNIVRVEGQRYNFSDIVDKFTAPPAKPEPKPPKDEPATFSLNNIQLTGGSVDFDDRPQKTKHQIRDMRLAIPFLSNLPYYGEIFVQPAFSAKANGTPIELKASTKPFGKARETSVDLVLTNLNVPFYLEYVPFKLQYQPVSAFVDANLDLTFAQPLGMKPSLFVSGTTAVRDLKLRELSGNPLLSFKRLDVAIERVDVFATKVAIRQIKLDEFDLTAHRARDGSINLMKLATVSKGGAELKEIREEVKAEEAAKAVEVAPPDKPIPEIRVEEIVLNGARVAWIDDVPDGSFRTTLQPLDVSVRNFSTVPGSFTEARLTATTDAREMLTVEAKYAFIERTAEGTVSLTKLSLKRYAPYYRKAILFDIEDGVLDASTRFTFANEPAGPKVAATEIETALTNLRLKKRGDPEPFFRMAQFQVHGGAFDLNKREVSLAEVTSKKASLAVKRSKDGAINLAELTPKPEPLPPAAPPPAPAPRPAADNKPWVLALRKLALDEYAVRFDDEVPAQPVQVTIDPIKLGVENFAFGGKPQPAKVDLALRINKNGELKAKGLVTPQPLDADINVVLTRLELPPFEPYVADKINITLASGEVAAEGAVKFAMPADGKALFEYEGKAAVNKLATLDKLHSEDFLKWESLFFDGIRLKSEPLFVDVKEVALTDFYSRLVVNADGTLNVQGIMAKGDDTPPATEAAQEPGKQPADPKKSKEAKKAPPEPTPPAADATAAVTKVVKIDRVTLQGGTINFSDRLIRPNVSATMTEVGGRVTGLMSDASTRADVELRGKLANQAPLTITGKINPLAGDLFADLKLSFVDIELPPFTPYSGKFAGYTIEKGKLSLDLTYLIDKRKLKAENRILIDQFTFGDKVESPDATKLPVQLAIALLKDKDGRINLDIPVEGSLDDPKFRLGKVIWGVIVNLITKAVTAPFALIGALVGGGGGEELSYLEFAPGSAVPDADGQKKLDQLVKALRDRPQLKLEATGHVDAEKDREALRQSAYQRKLKAQKFKDLAKKNQPPASVDEITVEAGPEYEKYLEAAYRAEKFPKPRNFIGMLKDLPVPEMEKLMQTNIVVTDDDLRTLAVQRAQAVKEAFLKAGDIGADRIFLVEPKSLAPEAKDKQKASRVDFVLK